MDRTAIAAHLTRQQDEGIAKKADLANGTRKKQFVEHQENLTIRLKKCWD